jgi:hypothetical protein
VGSNPTLSASQLFSLCLKLCRKPRICPPVVLISEKAFVSIRRQPPKGLEPRAIFSRPNPKVHFGRVVGSIPTAPTKSPVESVAFASREPQKPPDPGTNNAAILHQCTRNNWNGGSRSMVRSRFEFPARSRRHAPRPGVAGQRNLLTAFRV